MADAPTIRDAILSPCGRYRYRLARRWSDRPTCGFIMLNPSTADEANDDPTIRRCIGFAKREDCGGLIVVNLYSYRATEPQDLAHAPQPNGPDEARETSEAIRDMDGPVICAWGAHPMVIGARLSMLELIQAHRKQPMCLGTTKDGHPRHPLYLRADAALIPFGGAHG